MIVRFLLAVLLSPAFGQSQGRPITIDEAYQLSLKRSEALAAQGENVAELEARVSELIANVKPRVTLLGKELWQDQTSQTGGFTNSFAQREQPTAQINVHQPLFSGFRDFLAFRAAHRTAEAGDLDYTRAKQSLYDDVVQAYLALLGAHQDLETRRILVEQTTDRVKDLKQRESIGRSRRSEVLAAESQLANATAEQETSRGNERSAQWALRFLTGLEEDLVPSDISLPSVPGVNEYLARAKSRPDVLARLKDVEAAKLGVGLQSRQRWPSIGVDGNYYLIRPDGFSKDIKWDVTLSGSLPIYWGGQISAQTKEAQARERAAEQRLTLAMRTAELETRTQHDNLASALSRVDALEKAARAAEANAKAQAADYRLGLVTNLDVLSSLNTWQVARLAYTRSRLDAYLSLARLEVAAGGPR